jgi:hypothetical protein
MNLLQYFRGSATPSSSNGWAPARALRFLVLVTVLCCARLHAAALATGDLTLAGFGPASADSFSLVPPVDPDQATTIAIPDSVLLAIEGLQASADTSPDSSDLAPLKFQPIPEPQAWLIACCGLTTLVTFQRFRRGWGKRTR